VIAKIIMPKLGFDATPFFFRNMPLNDDHLWILYIWPIFFFFNIFGEEFYWRGYIQPRQELLNKNWTWLVHGLLWAAWHLPMGLDLIFAATPIFFILPAVVQIRKNTTIAIIVHFIFGAFGFLSLSLGTIH
jgi:membrane protease YdiL (CAAX protease family)